MTPLSLVNAPPSPARAKAKAPKARPVLTADVVGQFRAALRSPASMAVGASMGGFVPVAVFTLAHGSEPLTPLLWVILAAGSAFSLTKVVALSAQVFRSRTQGAMFAVLLEGVALAAPQLWLASAGLAFLVLINAVSLGCSLALRQRP